MGLEPIPPAPISALGMAMVLKRLLTFCLALVFLIGVTAELVPASIAPAEMAIGADMAGGCAGPMPPCTGHGASCVDHIGCVTVSALPASPASVAVAFESRSLDYNPMAESRSGISVKPELSPPILAA